MPRPKNSSRKSKQVLRKRPSDGRCGSCSGLGCLACLCVMVNVFVFFFTMALNQRLGGDNNTMTNDGQQQHVNNDNNNNPPQALQGVPQPLAQLRANANIPTEVITPKTFHFVFHMDCKDPSQDWQNYVFFYSIVKSGQVGDVTQIVTGCGPGGRKQSLQTLFDAQIKPMGMTTSDKEKSSDSSRSDNSRFHIHFAPAHPEQEKVGGLRKHLKYFNKASGLQHWMEEVLGYSETKTSTSHDDAIIVVMDADMVIMRPFEDGFDRSENNELWKVTLEETTTQGGVAKQAQHGRPMAQHTAYAVNWWQNLDVQSLPQSVSMGIAKLASSSQRDIDQHYSAGPPYLLTAKDFYRLVKVWNEATFPLYQILEEKILREPHGPYNVAAAVVQKPAQLASTFSVNDFHDAGLNVFESILNPVVSTKDGIKKSPPTCREFPLNLKPHVLNYSKRYSLGDTYIIGKHYVPIDFVGQQESCGEALFADPPGNIGSDEPYYMDPEVNAKVPIHEPKKVYQMAFMLCETIQALNDAAIHFKQNHCTGTSVNMEKTRIGNA